MRGEETFLENIEKSRVAGPAKLTSFLRNCYKL